MVMISIKMAFGGSARRGLPASPGSRSRPGMSVSHSETARPHLTAGRRCHCGVSRAGRFIWTYPLRGGGRGRATHRTTSTHLTGSISKQRMPEQKNHTPDHPKGVHVTAPLPPAPRVGDSTDCHFLFAYALISCVVTRVDP